MYDQYIRQIIKGYDVDLKCLHNLDERNLFHAINTIVYSVSEWERNKGKEELAELLKESISNGETIFEIAARLKNIK